MLAIRPLSFALTRQAAIEKMREQAHVLVDSLTARLAELESTSERAMRFDVYAVNDYPAFKRLFLKFRTQCEEFQALSHLAQDAIDKLELCGRQQWPVCSVLRTAFHNLQVPLLDVLVRTNLRLLRVWEDRLAKGEGLPIGTHEMFLDTVHTIHLARSELLRPRYLAMLENDALEDAERAEMLLRKLVNNAPALFNFSITIYPEADPWAKLDEFFLKLRQKY